ncbi:YjdF family protein [Paenibacillus hamazuiensis]|uniref:YjdF family protein n=1 Tax=Paenibacillus hamazuiensis TaxID=2936508 RepID=UPI00200D06DE|nr:YjdF family protein [Paenibacillus hamazuiensis]
MKLTVFFESPFWVGVVEDEENGKLRAFRHVFGAEPHDAEIAEFIDHTLPRLLERTSCAVDVEARPTQRINPKRLAREAAQEMRRKGVSSSAHATLQLELEHRKKARRTVSREQREQEEERKREIARMKAKAKHRGR